MKNVRNISRRNNKGIIDVQFNWIFVMIAGFVIFLFIISIIFSQKHAADKRADAQTINQVATLLKGKQQASSVYSEISLMSTKINFRCESIKTTVNGEEIFDNQLTFKIGDSNREELANSIIFAPEEMKTNKMKIWTLPFANGFAVNVFTYITTPDSIIIIYKTGDTPYASELNESLPENITKRITSDIGQYFRYKNIKIVCFSDDCPDESIRSKYGYIEVTPDASGTGLFDYGEVTFYGKLGGTNGISEPYLGEAGLYGAIFSDNRRDYVCQMERVMNQLEIKRLLVDTRLKFMRSDMEKEHSPSECTKTLDVARDFVDGMSGPKLDYLKVASLRQNAKSLDSINNKLIILSCPKIY